MSYVNFGSVYYARSDYSEALGYFEKALKIFKNKLGANHPETKNAQEWLNATKSKLN